MKKRKITKNTLKGVLAVETFLYGVLGLVVSSLYFAKDYYDFINHSDNTQLFWIGFIVLVAIIISSTLIMIGSSILFVIIVEWWNTKYCDKGELNG